MRSAHQHSVKFYATDESLFATVGSFVGQAVAHGSTGILIATAAHRRELLRHVQSHAGDVDVAQAHGDLFVLDAHETLGLLLADGMPDETKFYAIVGALIERIAADRGAKAVICAYGEMVDVLWRGGKCDAAIRLEMLWNELSTRYCFSLLCGYSMGNFFKDTSGFESVCAQHTHVVPPD